MKHLLKNSKISKLFPDEKNMGGMSSEVHLIRHCGKKYVLRVCKSDERADLFEEVSRKFEKYGFIPKLLGRHKNNLFFEYLQGRDLREKDALRYAETIGKICAIINKEKINRFKFKKWNYDKKFFKRLDFLLDKKIIDKEKSESVTDKYKQLKKKVKIKWGFDLGDIDYTNFRLSNGKIYFVDIEGVNVRLIGIGIAKPFLQWFRTPKQRKKFLKGYNSVRSSRFLTKDYLQFVYLCFLINNIFSKYKNKISYASNLRRLDKLLKGRLR